MNQPLEQDRFLRRARRRWMAWRVVECAGVCAALAAGVGLILVSVLVWRAEPALPLATTLLAIGGAAGAVWGLSRRPSILQTAVEADRQLGLNDLLSTAVLAVQSGDEAFAAVVIAQARAVCRTRSPNELVVRRLGGRAWGGIGIVSALVLTLSMFSTQPTVSQARTGSTSVSTGADHDSSQPLADTFTGNAAQHHLQPEENHDGASDAGEPRSGDSRSTSTGSNPSANPSADAAGSSAGRSDDARVPALKQGVVRDDGDSSTSPLDPSSPGSKTKAPGKPMRHVPTWPGADWSAGRDAALQDVQSGKVPDAYRDLVREYFNIHRDDEDVREP